jgi:hypothetical protein
MPRRRKRESEQPGGQREAPRTDRTRGEPSDERREMRNLDARHEMAAPLRAEAAQQLSRQHGNQFVARIQREKDNAKPAGPKKLPSDEDKKNALKAAKKEFSLPKLRLGFDGLDLKLEPPPPRWVTPPTEAEKPPDKTKPPWKPGKGPKKPKKGKPGDIGKALAKATTADRVPDLILEKLARDYESMRTGEKATVFVASVAIAGPALAAAVHDPESRDYMLKQLDGKEFTLPGIDVPTKVKFMTGKEKGFLLTVDLAKYVWK